MKANNDLSGGNIVLKLYIAPVNQWMETRNEWASSFKVLILLHFFLHFYLSCQKCEVKNFLKKNGPFVCGLKTHGHLIIIHSQKCHRCVASCQFYWLYNKLQQAYRFHLVATSLSKSDLLQFVICRLVATCWNNLHQASW